MAAGVVVIDVLGGGRGGGGRVRSAGSARALLPVGHAGQDVGVGEVGVRAHPVVPAHVLQHTPQGSQY